jgi:NADH-quinone oxidoreductase subunit N
MSQSVDWLAISPALCLVAAAILVLLGAAWWPSARNWLPTTISLAAVAAALGLMVALRDGGQTFCVDVGSEVGRPCSWSVDHVALVWWAVVLLGLGVIVLLVHPLVADGSLPAGELHLLLLASATGALGIAASGDLVTLLVCVETVSLPAFALVGLRRDRRGAEAALKFFLVSVVATAFSLLGISMVYGATGSVVAGPVRLAGAGAGGGAVTPVIGVGMALTVIALAFKIAAVPFQAWVPDTYVGAPIPVAAYLSVVSKAAGLAGIVVVLVRFFPSYGDSWRPVVAGAAALTMTVGNLAALRQRHAVRLLAWSSVAQAGYLLVPLAAGGEAADLGAMQSYAVMYAIVNLGAFAAVLAASRWGATTVDDMAGLARSRPLVGASLAFALLCLAGLPPGVIGLVAKVVIFQSAVDGALSWLAVVMAVNVAIGLVYYLRFVAALVRAPLDPRPGSAPDRRSRPDRTVQAVLALTLAAAVVLSVLPGPLLAVVYR